MSIDPGTLYVLQLVPPAIIALSPDGSGQRVILQDPGITPDGILVDARQERLIWTNMGSHDGMDFTRHDGTIECMRPDGSDRTLLVGPGLAGTPKQIQMDPETGRLYWCDREGMRVMRCDRDGGNVTVLVRNGTYPEDTHDLMRWCVGIAIDTVNRHLYWTQKGPDSAGRGRIFRIPLDLRQGQDPSARDDIVVLRDHLPEPIDLAIDHQNGMLYWTDRGHLEQGNSLNRARITGQGLVDAELLATGLQDGIGLALDLPRQRVFLADLGGNIWLHDLTQPPLTPLKRLATLGPLTGIEYVASGTHGGGGAARHDKDRERAG